MKGKSMDKAFLLRQSLEEMKNVEVPEIEDFRKTAEERQAQEQERVDSIKKSLEPHKDSLLSELQKIQEVDKDGNVVFEYDIDKPTRDKALGYIERYLVANNMSLTEENKSKIIQEFKEEYAAKNWRKINKVWMEESLNKKEEKHIQETHNEQPLNDQEKSDATDEKKEIHDSQRDAFRKMGAII